MAAIEELSPAAGPVSTRPPEDEIDDDEDEDVSGWSFWCTSEMWMRTKIEHRVALSCFQLVFFSAKHG